MALLKFKRSAVAGKVPTLSDLPLGELAINTFDGKIYIRKDNGTASVVEIGAGAGTGVLSFNTRTGAVTLTSGDVTGALGYTPYNATNPAGYITSSALSSYLPLSGGTLTGGLSTPDFIVSYSDATSWTTRLAAPWEQQAEILNNTTSGFAALTFHVYNKYANLFGYDENNVLRSNNNTIWHSGSSTISATGDVRAPIFYDSDNTGYYLNPNSISRLDATSANIYSRPAAATGYLEGAYGNGGESNSTTGPIYCISTGYAPTSTSLSNMYGIGYTDGNGSGVWAGAGWGMYVAADGDARVYLDGAYGIVYSTNSVRSPVFYDSNDTGRYVDPNDLSVLNSLTVVNRISGGINGDAKTLYSYTGENSGGLQYWNLDANATLNPSASWHYGLRMAHGDADTYYNATLAVNFFGDDFYLRRKAGGVDQTWRRFWHNGDSTISASGDFRAPIFYDTNDTAFYVDPNSTSVMGAAHTRGQVRATGWWGSYSANANGLGIEIGQSGGRGFVISFDRNTTSYGAMSLDASDFAFTGYASGYAHINTSFRAPIFYDTNDTAFYADMSSVSNFNQINLGDSTKFIRGGATGQTILGTGGVNEAYLQVGSSYYSIWNAGNFDPATKAGLTSSNTYTGTNYFFSNGNPQTSNSPSLQAWTNDNASGAWMSFHRSSQYAINMGLDSSNVFRIGGWSAPSDLFSLNMDGDLAVKRFISAGTGGFRQSAYNANARNRIYSFADADGYGISYFQGAAGVGSADTIGMHFGLATGGGSQFIFVASGYGQASASFRAPIFYDSDNTSYYIDAASSSNVNSLTAQILYAQSSNDAQLYLNGNGTSWAGISFSDVSNTDYVFYNGSTSTFSIGGGGSAVANKKLHINGGVTIGNGLASTSVATNGLLVETQIAAPIFYDSEDAAWFINPAGRSRTQSIDYGNTSYYWAGGDWGWRHNTPYGWIQFGPANTSHAHIYTDRTNFYFNAQIQVLGGSQINQTDIRASTFYDTDNTAYFADPSSTSVFNVLRAGAIQFTNGNEAIRLSDTNYNRLNDPTGRVAIYLGGGSDNNSYYDNSSHNFRDRNATLHSYITAAGIWAGAFTDFNNTAYYVDPASNSVLNALYLRNSSGVEALAANTSSFGYSSSYRAVILGNQYLTTISLGYDPISNLSGNFNGGGEGREVLFRNGVNFVTPNSANNNYLYPLSLADGYSASTGSFRAPVFYDSNNTNYYVDPQNGSVFGGAVAFSGGSYVANNGDVYARRDNATTGVYYFADGGSKYLYWDGANYLFGSAGAVNTPNSMLASNFYDVANTAYYLDPNGASRLATMTIDGMYSYGGITTDGSLTVGFNSVASYIYMSDTDEGTRVIHCNSNQIGFLTQVGGWGAFCTDDGGWYSNTAMYAPIYYDLNNTGFYVDPNSTSNLSALSVNGGPVYRSDWTNRFQSQSDFVDGTLVSTDIPATASAGESFIIEITGKSYDGSNPPFKVVAQGYLYNDTIINFSGINYGGNFSSYVRVFQDGGVLKFWWPRISYWNSFNVNVMAMDGQTNNTITRNRITSISNSTEPTGTKKVTINLVQSLRQNTWQGSTYFGSDGAIYGTVFYDSNNGAYYADPASNSNLYSLTLSGNTYFQPNSWIQFNGSYGLYWPNSNGAHIEGNTSGSYTQLGLRGQKGGYGGLFDLYSSVNGIMYDGAGNGGVYREPNGRWYFYHNVANDCTGFGTSTTVSGYNIYVPTGLRSDGRVDGSLFYDVSNTAFYLDPNATGTSLNVAGAIIAAGNVTAYSDIRVKDNIETVENALAKVAAIRGVTYTRKDLDDKERRYAGVIAQEVEQVLPEAVGGDEHRKTVDYNGTIALLIEAVKELTSEVETLKAAIRSK